MWKKDDVKSQGVAENIASPAVPMVVTTQSSASPSPSPLSLPVSPRAAACISQGIRIKGEVTGSEDLFVDGLVEGKLNLTSNSCLTIGPNGTVKADLNAREIIIRGKVEGKVTARDKLQIWSTGVINGEVQTDRLAIEDGALLRGKVEAGKQPGKAAEAKAAAAATSASSPSTAINSGTAAD
ncbi:MAG TPA: polymer-forming cytoskeletal protein [Candidatus Angelobacter sp.]|nr:polymer-forming cytoskeletal protein [Candidatus Angelobacter sp.]